MEKKSLQIQFLSLLASLGGILCFLPLAQASVIISTFGNGADSIGGATFNDTWIGALTENATASTIGSPATDFGGFVLIKSFNLTGNTGFTISAKLDSLNSAAGFTVTAYNSVSNYAAADFAASSFNSLSFTSVTSDWITSGSFNPASVVRWGISGGSPSSTTNFRITFDNLQATSAVPEPGTLVLLTIAAGGGIISVRRRLGR